MMRIGATWIAVAMFGTAGVLACEPEQLLPSVGESLVEVLCPALEGGGVFGGLFSGLDGPEPQDVRRLGLVLNGFERELIQPKGKMDKEAGSLVDTLSENRGLVVALRGTLLQQQFPRQDLRYWCEWRQNPQEQVEPRRMVRIKAVDEAAECGLSD